MGSIISAASRSVLTVLPRSPRPTIGIWLVAAGFLLVVLTGCGPFVDPYNLQDRADQPAGLLGAGRFVAQTFVAHGDGMNRIDVQVAIFPTIPRSNGLLRLRLWAVDGSPDPSAPVLGRPLARLIAVREYAESALEPNQWITFTFPPVTDSNGRTFLLEAQTTDTSTSAVTLWASGHVANTEHRRSEDGQWAPGSLVYRVFRDEPPGDVIVGTLSTINGAGWIWPMALVLCIVPGLSVASLQLPRQVDAAELLGLSIGWSVLLAPLALVVATPVRVGPVMGLALLIAGATIAAWRRPRLRLSPWSAVALVASVVALAIRAVDAKGLVAPMWGDPVQHSYVAALILEAHGVPATYGSILPSQVFDYHFGFQTIAAFAAWLGRGEPAQAILATGQIIDALVCLSVYRLAIDLVGSRRAGAVAAVLVAMVMTQPSYFVTWGRYPELAALAALPAAYAALRRALVPSQPRGWERENAAGTTPNARVTPITLSTVSSSLASSTSTRPKLRGKGSLLGLIARFSRWAFARIDLGIGAVAAAALVLVHPRVGVFLACLGVARVISNAIEVRSIRRAWMLSVRLAAVGAISLVLLAPWATRLWAAHRQQVVATYAWQPLDLPLGLALAGNDRWVLELAVLGWVIGLARRPAVSVLFGVWSILVLAVANPATFHLPFNLFVNGSSVAIALFMPASILTGHLFTMVSDRAAIERWPNVARWALAGAVLAGGLTQAPSLTTIVNPCCLLIRPGDLGAISWVRENTPPNARFLINGYRWMDQVWMGTDAGYWLPVLAHRQTTLPPLFYAVGPPDQVAQISHLAATVSRDASNPAALASLARQNGVRYVFIGSRGGDLDPVLLRESGLFRVDYADGGAWVLEVVSSRADPISVTVTGTTPEASDAPRS